MTHSLSHAISHSVITDETQVWNSVNRKSAEGFQTLRSLAFHVLFRSLLPVGQLHHVSFSWKRPSQFLSSVHHWPALSVLSRPMRYGHSALKAIDLYIYIYRSMLKAFVTWCHLRGSESGSWACWSLDELEAASATSRGINNLLLLSWFIAVFNLC